MGRCAVVPSRESALMVLMQRKICAAGYACLAVAFYCAVFCLNGFAYASTSEFIYDGDDVAFIAVDGSELATYSRKDDPSIEYQSGVITVNYLAGADKNETGFYLCADKDDDATWDKNLFFPRRSNGGISFDLDAAYAGMAWPIVPCNSKDMPIGLNTQYYLAIPPLEKIPGYLLTVTFVDGYGNDLGSQVVVSGQGAVAPQDPKHDGFVFKGWDQDFGSIYEDTVVTAVWALDEEAVHTVTFEDGWGNVLKTEAVQGGRAAMPPDNPIHEGYQFLGWSSDAYDFVTEDLVVTALWISNDEAAFEAARAAIAALPDDPKTIVGQTSNEAVAAAVAAYNALPDNWKSQLTDAERMKLAKCAIAVLPYDPYDVTENDRTAIAFAQSLYNSLSGDQRNELDAVGSTVHSSTTYGRYLENNLWALDSLTPITNSTALAAGTYTGQAKSEFNMGKNTSPIRSSLKVLSVTVKDGAAMALVEHTASLSESLKVGGIVYERLESDASKYACYEIPVKLNSPFHLSVKSGGNEDNPAITYEMIVTANESSMKPDSEQNQETVDPGKKDDTGTKKPDSKLTPSGGKLTPSGAKLTPTGAGNAAGATPASGASQLAATRASNASNLSSLLRASDSQASSKKDTSAKASASSSPAGVAANDARISEVALGSAGDAPAVRDIDIAPAVAGGCLLLTSLGALAFVLMFIRRESSLA